jgi:hypothetical protein
MFYNDRNERFHDIVWVIDFSLVSIAVEKIKSTPRERLPEAIYFL